MSRDDKHGREVERLHGLIENLAMRFKGYLPWPEEKRDAVVRGHEAAIEDTIKKADAIMQAAWAAPSSIAAMDRLRPDVIKIRNDEARAVLGEIMAYVTTDQRIRELIEKRIEERGLSDPAPVSATGASDVQRQDMTRLEWLSELLKHCPHAELIYNDEDGADGPVGFSLHVQSCTTMQLHAPTLEALIDLGMSAEPDEDGDVIATADDTAKNYAPPTKAGM